MPQVLLHPLRLALIRAAVLSLSVSYLVPELASAQALPAAPAPSFPTLPTLPTLHGPLGLFHASTAEVGPRRQLRMGLHGEYFGANDFLIPGDANQRLAGGLTVGYTLRRNLELFGALLNSSNRNRRDRAPGDRDPELIKTFGDLVVGGKWILPLSPAATFGVELGLKFLSGVSELAISPSSTSWWLGPLFSYDLRRAANLPLRVHAGASFYADNSSNLHALSGVSLATKEVARFGYGIAPSRLRLALAVDAPLDRVLPRVPIVPFVEYHVAYVTADADRDFQDFMRPNCDDADPTRRPCIDNRDLQSLTLGVRAALHHGLTAGVGVDIRIRSPGFPYGPPLAPYNVLFGVAYPLDLDALTRTVIVTRTVEPDGPWKTEGHLQGTVRSARGGAPIAGTIIAVVGRARARAASDADGGFATPQISAGPVELEVTAPGFSPVRVSATVVAGQGSQVDLQLVPNPPKARVHGRVTDPLGAGLQASLRFMGGAAEVVEVQSDASGAYATSLPDGLYEVRAEASGLPPRSAPVEATAGEDRQLDFVLRAPGGKRVTDPNIVLGAKRITIRKPLRFVGASPQLTPESEKLLDGVADLLDGHAEIKQVRIVAHWDTGLPRVRALELTQAQAEAVRAYLRARGVAEGRLVATGQGAAHPLVPSLTPANRARNRRVEFLLDGTQQGQQGAPAE